MLCLQHCCHPLARGQQAAPAYRIVVLFIHSARSATGGKPQITITIQVSIHAFLAECDTGHAGAASPLPGFNPRTPYGVRPSWSSSRLSATPFQSTHSLRSATVSSAGGVLNSQFQSTHSLRSATGQTSIDAQSVSVSIHALLAECDLRAGFFRTARVMFQSTHSLRSATNGKNSFQDVKNVSIHALLAECDYFPC